MESMWDSNPRPPHHVQSLGKGHSTNVPHVCSYHIYVLYIFKLNTVYLGGGPGWGLAPAPGFICTTCDLHYMDLHVHFQMVLPPFSRPTLVTCHILTIGTGAIIRAGTWPHAPHAPNTSAVWGLGSLTVRHWCTICGNACMCWV
jgi:hypothetical protein